MLLIKDILRIGAVSLAALAACFYMEFVRAEGGQQTSHPVIQEIVVAGAKGLRCPIRFRDPYRGRITDDSYAFDISPYPENGLAQLFLTFECLSLHDDADRIRGMTSARFNEQEDRWEPDLSARTALERRGTRTLRFNAVNSQGAGATYEPTNGDPKTRDRYFAFCLRHPPVALCISSSQIARPYYKHSDLLPFAMTIIKSIEFIDKPPAPAADGEANNQE